MGQAEPEWGLHAQLVASVSADLACLESDAPVQQRGVDTPLHKERGSPQFRMAGRVPPWLEEDISTVTWDQVKAFPTEVAKIMPTKAQTSSGRDLLTVEIYASASW